MKRIFTTVLAAMIITSASGQMSFHIFLDSINKITDPVNKVVLIDTFLTHLDTAGTPYIEGDTANFIYHGTADSVRIAGDFNDWGNPTWKCERISETNFFYYSHIFEQTARLDYKFIINKDSWILDPRNPNQVSGGYGPNSELAMPGYVQPWEIEEYDGVAQGTIESFSLESPQVGKTFNIKVYLPPGYEEGGDHDFSTVYVHDGSEYIGLGSMDHVLDNLLDSNKIDPLIAVFITPVNRNDEYAGNMRNDFAEFIAETVVPHIDANYKTYPHNAYRLTMGTSYGGNISAIISYYYPEVFGNSGWHSPALQPNNFETAYFYYSGEKKDVKLYFNVGTYEFVGYDWEDFTTGVVNNGYSLVWKYYHEGHSWGFWRATIDDILTYFFPPGTTPVGIENSDISHQQNSIIYPNPSGSIATIALAMEQAEDYFIHIYNQLGQLQETSQVKGGPVGEFRYEIDVSKFEAGIYHYVVKGSEKAVSGKMVVE